MWNCSLLEKHNQVNAWCRHIPRAPHINQRQKSKIFDQDMDKITNCITNTRSYTWIARFRTGVNDNSIHEFSFNLNGAKDERIAHTYDNRSKMPINAPFMWKWSEPASLSKQFGNAVRERRKLWLINRRCCCSLNDTETKAKWLVPVKNHFPSYCFTPGSCLRTLSLRVWYET